LMKLPHVPCYRWERHLFIRHQSVKLGFDPWWFGGATVLLSIQLNSSSLISLS
jgi:hypothetical protein